MVMDYNAKTSRTDYLRHYLQKLQTYIASPAILSEQKKRIPKNANKNFRIKHNLIENLQMEFNFDHALEAIVIGVYLEISIEIYC